MIRLVVADDHPIVREGLKCLVEPYGDIRLVGEAIDGHDALTKARELRPDVLLRDVSMPGPHVLEVLGQPGSVTPTVAVLVLSVHPERLYAVRALRTGAAGYLTKDRSAEELIGAIRHVYTGGRYVTSTLAELLADEVGGETPGSAHQSLSNREYEVFRFLTSGHSVSEIGARLSLSPKTVSTYRARLFKKIRCKSNADLVRYAADRDLV
jgi:DNA-binding NarL/FixJ family response regulator